MDKQQLAQRISNLESNIQNAQSEIQRMQNDLNQKTAQLYALLGAREELTNVHKELEEKEKALN